MHKIERYGAPALIGLYVIVMLVLNSFSPLLYWDENAYLGNARSIVGESKFVEDFRHPLLELVIGSVWTITGESILVAKLIMIAFSACAACLFYLLCLGHIRQRALIGLALFLFNPLMLTWGSRVYTDVAGVTLLLAGMLLMRGSAGKYLLAGLCFGLASMMRFTYMLYFGLTGLYLIYLLWKNRNLASLNRGMATLLGFFAAVLPFLIYDKITHKEFFWTIIQQFNMGYGQTAQSWTLQAVNIIWVLGPIILAFLFGGYHALMKRRDEYLYWTAIALIYSAYIIFSTPIKEQRYIAPVLPLAILIGLYGLGLIKHTQLRIGAISILITYMILSSGITTAMLIKEGQCNSDGAIMQSIEYMRANSKPDDVVFSNVWPYIGYYNNLEVFSFWTDAERAKYKADYILVHSRTENQEKITGVEGIEHVKTFAGCDGSVDAYKITV